MSTQAVKVKNGELRSKPEGFSPSSAIQKVRDQFHGAVNFLHDVRMEMRQVTWPTRDEVRSTTAVVIITVIFFGIYLWIVDLGVQKGLDYILRRFNA